MKLTELEDLCGTKRKKVQENWLELCNKNITLSESFYRKIYIFTRNFTTSKWFKEPLKHTEAKHQHEKANNRLDEAGIKWMRWISIGRVKEANIKKLGLKNQNDKIVQELVRSHTKQWSDATFKKMALLFLKEKILK